GAKVPTRPAGIYTARVSAYQGVGRLRGLTPFPGDVTGGSASGRGPPDPFPASTSEEPMAYPICPGCREPQLVADEAVEFRCFTCGTQVLFLSCGECGLKQAIPATWTMFTCSKCRRASRVPRYIPFEVRPRASKAGAVGL